MNKQNETIFINFLNTNLHNNITLSQECINKNLFELSREYKYKAHVFFIVLETYKKLNQKRKTKQ